MKARRYQLVFLTAIAASSAGCASTARRDDGSPVYGARAWNEAPAPPQRQAAFPVARADQPAETPAPRQGLARYFPGLTRNSAEPTKLAATRPAPSWFGLRKAKAEVAPTSRTYMTDAREQLNRTGPMPTSLPVALQVPTERASADGQVTTTAAETPAAPPSAESSPATKDVGGEAKPAPAVDLAGPKETVATVEPERPMPPIPAVDPLEATEASKSPEKPAVEPAPDDDAVQASRAEAGTSPAPPEADEPPKPTTPVAETSIKVSPASAVLPSPQGAEPATKHHVHTTSKVKPTPQAAAGSGEAKTWRRPCLRRLIRRTWKLGEFADPPTAAPH